MNNNVVYMHKNKINNKVYIGQISNIQKRWHSSSYIGCTYFYHAIQKYGWENFEHIILENNLTQEKADQKEQEYINKFQATDSNFGYNLSEGGNKKAILKGPHNGFYGKKHSEESLQIMRKKKYGGNNPTAKAVRCLNTNEIFPSCREASNWCGISRQNIQRCCRGGRPTAGKHPITGKKLKWRYIEDEI